MRTLFLPMVGGRGLGPLTQCLALAGAAKIKGHTIAFLCKPEFRPWIEAEGYAIFDAPTPVRYTGPLPDFFKLADVALALGLADVGFIRASIEAELRAIDDFEPDVLVSQAKLTAPISAEITKLPLVSTATWPDNPKFTSPLYKESKSVPQINAAYNNVLHEYSQNLIEDVGELSYLRSNLKIAPSSSEIEPQLVDIQNLHYVGFLLYEGIEERNVPIWLEQWDPEIPLIYVYLGVGDIGPEVYTHVLPEAFDGTEFHVVVSVSRHPRLPVLPPSTSNVRYVESVPGLAIMRKSKLVIHHGGVNTTVSAILAGVPTLMVPGSDAERDFNCRNSVRLGCGKLIPVSSFNADSVRRAVGATLGEVSLSNIQDLAYRLRQLGGAQQAWRLIEQL